MTRPETDSFGSELPEWLRAIPGPVDPATEGVRQRIGRISRQFERILATVAAEHDLSVGDWEALSALARSDDGASGVTPGRIGAILGLTSGTVSVRIDRLVRAGLLAHVEDDDGRARPVRLTTAGRAAWGAATLTRTDTEARLIGDALSSAEVDRLNILLGRLLARLDAEYGPAPRHDMTRGRRSGRG